MIELKPIMGGGYWASGPDTTGNDGECELTSKKFEQYLESLISDIGMETWETAVKEFLSPLTEVLESMEKPADEDVIAVVKEPVEGRNGLAFDFSDDPDGAALYLIHTGKQERLRWVDQGRRLIVLA